MAQAEPTQRKQDHRIKRPLPHFDIGTSLGVEIAQFSPFGWSKDGKFAWINQPPCGESDIFVTQYFIQDMVTNTVLWKGSYAYDISLADSLQERNTPQVTFHSKLAEYHIVRSKLEWLELPIHTSFDTLGVILSKETMVSEMGEGIAEANIIVRSRHKGEKKVYYEKFDQNDPSLQDMALAGYVPSPYEDRVALVICRRDWGFVGIRYVNYGVVGVHLKAGWR